MFSFSACGNNITKTNCTNCGKELLESVSFCPNCGAATSNKIATDSTVKTSNTNDTSNVDDSQNKNTLTSNVIKPAVNSKNTNQSSKTAESVKSSTPVHKHSYTKKVIDPTCTNKGYTIYTCSCGDSYKSDYVDATHTYSDYVCTKCGAIDKSNAYKYLVKWVKDNGTANGAYINYRFNATYALSYSANDKVLFVLNNEYHNGQQVHCSVQLDTYFYYFVFGENTVMGYLDPADFTENSAISYTEYVGDNEDKYIMLECARVSVCDLLEMFKNFLADNNIGITISDLGFQSF